MSKKKWMPIAWVVFLIQLLLEGYAAFRIVKLNMLPTKYLIAAFVVLILMLLITGLMLFIGPKQEAYDEQEDRYSRGRYDRDDRYSRERRDTYEGDWSRGKSKRSLRRRRVFAVLLAIIMGLSSILLSMMVSKLDQTVEVVTKPSTALQAMVGVYVMDSSSAQSIEDLKNESFGIMSDFDQENTTYAVNYLKDLLQKEITTVERPSMVENAEALYNGSVAAIIMNEAYAGSLPDFEGFETFETDTRLVLEIPVETVVEVSEDEEVEITAEVEGTFQADEVPEIEDVTKDPFVVYVSGSDTRSKILNTSRSDVNILMVVNPTTKQILLLNTPRDYYVANPAGDGAMDKLTHCGIYGVECSEQALSDLYDVDVNFYGQINFTGFETLIDSIGGITVESPQAFTAEEFTYTAGENQMSGAKALAFARERYSFSSGDNMRGQNQMKVITAVIQKLTSNGATLLMNYTGILNSLQGMFVTDFDSEDIDALVKMQLGDGGSWNIKSYAVTGGSGSEYTYSAPGSRAYVMYQDANMVQHAHDLIEKVKAGEILTDEDVTFTGSTVTSTDDVTSAE